MPEEFEVTSVKKSKAPLYISGVVIAALVLGYFFIPPIENFINTAWSVLTSDDEKRIERWIWQFGWIGPAVIILTMIVQMFLIVIPTPALMIVSIVAYGPVWGSLILFVAIFIASSLGYLIGSYFGPVLVDKLIGRKTNRKLTDFIEHYGFWTVVIVRLVPFLSNDAVSFVGGVLKMGYWKFMGATLIGISPLILLIAYLGEDYTRLKTGLIWGSAVCLIIFIGFVWWDKKKGHKIK